MVTFCQGFKELRFPVLEPAFCLSSTEFLTVLTTSFMDYLGHSIAVELVFVQEKRFNAMSVLKNNSKVNAPIKFVNAGFKLFCNNLTVHLNKASDIH